MFITLADFASLSGGLQSVAVTLAAVIGGAWALYRFRNLREQDTARAELERLQRSLQERGTLKVALTTRDVVDSTTHQKYLAVRTEFVNVGSRSEVLKWETGGIWCARLQEMTDGVPVFSPWTKSILVNENGPVIAAVLAPGESYCAEFLVHIPSVGVYLVSLSVDGSPEETKEVMAARHKWGGAEGAAAWAATSWVSVPDSTRPHGGSIKPQLPTAA